MPIRVINPNPARSMTDRIGAAARTVASPSTKIVSVSPEMGPASIEGHNDEANLAVRESVRAHLRVLVKRIQKKS